MSQPENCIDWKDHSIKCMLKEKSFGELLEMYTKNKFEERKREPRFYKIILEWLNISSRKELVLLSSNNNFLSERLQPLKEWWDCIKEIKYLNNKLWKPFFLSKAKLLVDLNYTPEQLANFNDECEKLVDVCDIYKYTLRDYKDSKKQHQLFLFKTLDPDRECCRHPSTYFEWYVDVVLNSGVDMKDFFNINGDSILIDAIRKRRSEKIIKKLVSMINVNKGNKHGNTPLHYAAHYRCLYSIKSLIRAGADMNAKSCHGKTPLSLLLEDNENDDKELLSEYNSYEPIPFEQRNECITFLCKTGNVIPEECITFLCKTGNVIPELEVKRQKVVVPKPGEAKWYPAFISKCCGEKAGEEAARKLGFNPHKTEVTRENINIQKKNTQKENTINNNNNIIILNP